ncbi:MAG TPA: glycoside hydrolase family 48 protein [Kutzneria sp.]|nr:glycoside hydrolase family 48 protein [Kutzneria sp.]
MWTPTLRWRSRRMRRLVTTLACLLAGVVVVATSGSAAAVPRPAAAASTCQVAYSVTSDWGSGFGVSISITNTGPAISSWTLQYSYSGNQQVQQGWNGTWTQSGAQVTVTNASWNGTLGTGAATQIGANFTNSGGTNTAPTAFTVNGLPCNGSGNPQQPPPTVAITSPTAGSIFTPGSAITLQANAASTGTGSVKQVQYFASTSATSNTLIGVATTSPWAFQWTNVPAGSYSLTAVATDDLGQTTTSDPVAITVAAASIVATPTSLSITQGSTGKVGVKLSSAPAATVTVSAAITGDPDLTVSAGGTLTFTPANWNVAQQVTIAAGTDATEAGGHGTLTLSGTGYTAATVALSEVGGSSGTGYDAWFLSLYNDIKNPANGYFSPKGIPYHSVETLIVEAPDYGHETTSETYSYWLWLEADYGRVTGDWTGFTTAWANMEQFMIPGATQQPGQSTYNPAKPATYGPGAPLPSDYPVALNSSVPVGSDPLAAELKSTYGTSTVYAPAWIMDVDNKYGFGQCEDGTSTPSLINTFQRGPEESVWNTIPQPDCDMFKFGGPNGFLDLFNNGGGSFAKQYKFTDAPDADARMVQAAYWADTYAKAQGKTSAISATLGKASELGDFLRYSMFDKYFKQIGDCLGSTTCPAGTSKSNEDTYLMSWYYAWGGAADGTWSWRIGGDSMHEGYQNPMAAFVLSTDSDLIPKSPTAKSDWSTSMTRQLQFYQWLQSAEGAIAGGATNNWGGNYGDVTKPPAGDPTFYGMYYDWQPEYHNPPSNQWFGFQTWPMERIAELYYASGDTTAKSILDKWVRWAESVTKADPSTGTLTVPGTLNWSGAPNTFDPSNPGAANTTLHVTTADTATDLGVAASLAKVYSYYAAKSGDTTARTAAQNIIDIIHKNYADSLGYSAPETRTDYKNFTVPYDNTNLEGVYVPANWSGTYPDGTKINSSTNTFLSIRPWYKNDPAWPKVQAYLNGGPAPVFNYHRFWGEADIATAFDTFAQLFPTIAPPAGS